MLTLKSRISAYDAGSLLDVAVGRGDFLKFAINSFRSWHRAAGIDVDAETLQQAGNVFANSPVILILASALNMPFTDQYFDTITLSNTLHHIEKLQLLFNETARVSKQHGLIVINEMLNESYHEAQETYMLYHRFIADADNQQGKFHREPFNLKELLNIIKNDQFQLLEYFIHEEAVADIMNEEEMAAMASRLKNKVKLLKGSSYYYFYENKANDIISRFKKTGIQRPRHVTFMLQTR
jgi:ubiquinone/menaquinone biosynthesis C-methylase UbiE